MRVLFEGLSEGEVLARVGLQSAELERLSQLLSWGLLAANNTDCGKCGDCGNCNVCKCFGSQGDIGRPPDAQTARKRRKS
jgi:hypothetical protein